MADLATVQAWLDLAYPASPGREERFHVGAAYATQPGWRGRGVTRDQVAATVAATEQTEPLGIYLSVCTYRSDAVISRKAADTAWCFGMWSDLDIAGPGHKHDPAMYNGLTLPPDEESARKIVTASVLPEPSAWIHSGGGLYAWWLLDTPAPASECGGLSRAWQAALGRAAQALGWHYGTGVSDLARVLRLPGTVNRKVPGEPRPCRLLSTDGPRYTRGDMTGHAEAVTPLARLAAQPRTAPATGAGGRRDQFMNPGPPDGPDVFGAFRASVTWAAILQPHDWTHEYRHGDGYDLWRHPNASSPKSAVTGRTPADTMECYSTNAGLPEVHEGGTLTKEYVWAALRQGVPKPDMARARTELAAIGYGSAGERAVEAVQAFEARGLVSAEPPDSAQQWADLVAKEALRLRLRAEAAELFAAEQHARLWTPPGDHGALTAELALPDDAAQWRLFGLLGAGHNAVLVAGRKAGKTTMVGNLVRSYVDGELFLGRFKVEPADAAVAVFNYEVDERQYRRWLREVGIVNTDRVFVLHLRGRALPLKDARVRAWVAAWLRERSVGLWVVDPYSRAYVGSLDNGNDEAQVGAFLDTLDVIKADAGVSELVMPVHTPKARAEAGEETAIGSQRLEGWPDSMWYLTRDLKNGLRFLRAEGRDVDVAEEQLSFDAPTRRLTLGGWDRAGVRQHADVARLIDYVTEHPGCSGRDIESGLGWGHDRMVRARENAGGRVRTEKGERNSQLHYAVTAPTALERSGERSSSAALLSIESSTDALLGAAPFTPSRLGGSRPHLRPHRPGCPAGQDTSAVCSGC